MNFLRKLSRQMKSSSKKPSSWFSNNPKRIRFDQRTQKNWWKAVSRYEANKQKLL